MGCKGDSGIRCLYLYKSGMYEGKVSSLEGYGFFLSCSASCWHARISAEKQKCFFSFEFIFFVLIILIYKHYVNRVTTTNQFWRKNVSSKAESKDHMMSELRIIVISEID